MHLSKCCLCHNDSFTNSSKSPNQMTNWSSHACYSVLWHFRSSLHDLRMYLSILTLYRTVFSNNKQLQNEMNKMNEKKVSQFCFSFNFIQYNPKKENNKINQYKYDARGRKKGPSVYFCTFGKCFSSRILSKLNRLRAKCFFSQGHDCSFKSANVCQ